MKARIPKGMGGGPANMQSMIKQAQKMQEDMENLQNELNEREHEVSAGGGAVTVKIKGDRQVLEIKLDPDVVDPDDVETLEDAIVAAYSDAHAKIVKMQDEGMKQVTGGVDFGGLKLPF